MNIVSMGMKYLGPTVATKVASMLGVQSPTVVKLIAAALPTVLAAFTGKAASAGGASSLLGLIQDQPIDSPEGFEAALAGPQGGDISQAGGSMLMDLLGGDTTNAITGALQQHGGVDQAGAASLLGMIAPAALGSLKNSVSEGNLDASGLASMLSDQKANIADAMPSDFADSLKGTGLLDSIAPADPTPAATPAPAAVAAAEPSSGGGGGIMKLVAGAVIVGGLAWYFLGGSTPEVPEMPEMPDIASLADGVDLTVGDVDLGEQFGGVLGDLSGTFSGITDAASAEAALPGLEAASEQLGGISDLAGQLPEQAQGVFGGIVSSALATLQPMIQGAIDASGAGALLQPVVDGIISTLEGMAG